QSGEFHSKNPVRSVPAMKRKISEMTYLTHEEIIRLLNFSNGDARRITLLCLSTGARWGEAKSLRAEHIIDNRVIFNKTKNGKVRIVPVSNEVVREIKTKDSGMLFDVDYGEYRKMLRAVKPDLPKGQAVHVLRHTFATHFMMNGGSIIALQRVLGHANIQQTMIYAHFAPDYLSDVLKFNPVANANIAKEKEPAE
ncbi:tyrosine-type recombinase/integrase, partial [Escherichia coli]